MNTVKYYYGNTRSKEIKLVKINQTRSRISREIKCKQSLIHPDGLRSIKDKRPTLAEADRRMIPKGWVR